MNAAARNEQGSGREAPGPVRSSRSRNRRSGERASPELIGSWRLRFPWLRYDDGELYCATCATTHAVRQKPFVHRIDALVDHAKTTQHITSTRIAARSERQPTVLMMAQSAAAAQLTPLILAVRYVVQHNAPLSHVPHLVGLMADAGADNVSDAYLSDRAVREMLAIVADSARANVIEVRMFCL